MILFAFVFLACLVSVNGEKRSSYSYAKQHNYDDLGSHFPSHDPIYAKLDSYLNFTSIASLVSAGDTIAFVASRQGVANVFAVSLPNREIYQLSNYTEV